MLQVTPLLAPVVGAYGANYQLYMKHYEMYRSFVEQARDRASQRNEAASAAKKQAAPTKESKGKEAAKEPATPPTEAQIEGRKAHKKHLRREKRARRKLRDLKREAEFAKLGQQIAGAKKVTAQAFIAETKARAEVPLTATKVKVAAGVYANAELAAHLKRAEINRKLNEEASKAQTNDVKAETARVKAETQLRDAQFLNAAAAPFQPGMSAEAIVANTSGKLPARITAAVEAQRLATAPPTRTLPTPTPLGAVHESLSTNPRVLAMTDADRETQRRAGLRQPPPFPALAAGQEKQHDGATWLGLTDGSWTHKRR